MRHVAEGSRQKKPFQPRNQAKKPKDWKETVRLSVGKKLGGSNLKKAQATTPWRKNRDGFMVTSREDQPSENQIDSLEQHNQKKISHSR